MARVIAMLREARAAGLEVRRDGAALVVRGAAKQEHLARDLIDHKPLVLAALEQEEEEECREHERAEHLGEPVDWRLSADGALVCCVCDPTSAPDQGDGRAAGVDDGDHRATVPGQPPCAMCGSVGRCQGRLAMPDGGWVCLAAVADGVLRNGRFREPGRQPRPEAG